MNGNVITLPVNIIYIGDMTDIPGQIPGRLHGNIRIVAQNLHSQMNSRIGYLHAYGTQTNDSQFLPLNLMACKLFLLLFRQLGDLLVLPLGLYPVHAADDIPGGQQKSRQHQLLHTVGIGSRRIEHHDSLLGTFSHGNVVDPCSCTGNGVKIIRQIHIMHGRAADQQSICLLDFLYFFILSCKMIQAEFCYGI